MIDFPTWLSILVGLGNVEEVSGNIGNEHGLLIDLIESKARVLSLIGGGGCENGVESDGFRLVESADGSSQVEGLVMGVAEKTESNDVLETIGKGLETGSPSTEAAMGRDMSEEDSDLTLSFHVSKDTLEPLDFIAWI